MDDYERTIRNDYYERVIIETRSQREWRMRQKYVHSRWHLILTFACIGPSLLSMWQATHKDLCIPEATGCEMIFKILFYLVEANITVFIGSGILCLCGWMGDHDHPDAKYLRYLRNIQLVSIPLQFLLHRKSIHWLFAVLTVYWATHAETFYAIALRPPIILANSAWRRKTRARR